MEVISCDPREVEIMKKPWFEEAKALARKMLEEMSGG